MPQRRSTGRLLLLVAFLCCAAALGLLMFKQYEARWQTPTPPAAPQTESSPYRVVVLFFATTDGSGLARESREIDSCADHIECIRMIITELVKGPVGDLEPTLPPQTVVNGVSEANGIVTVDLGGAFVEGLPGGSSSEMAAVYSMVNSIAVNIPGVTAVRFLIDGKETATLKGNLDMRHPLPPDFMLEKKPDGSPAGGPTPTPAPVSPAGTPSKDLRK